MIPQEWFRDAELRIQPQIATTPLIHDSNHDIYIKWENHQLTKSFKVRGALNKVFTLIDWEKSAGLVTASAGNHGQGVALAGKIVKSPVSVFVPQDTPQTKLQAMTDLGAQIYQIDGGYGQSEKAGMEFAQEHGATWISAYNDLQVIAGQGTVALETIKQLSMEESFSANKSVWVVPVGGGGLVAGIGSVLKSNFPRSKLLGVQSEASPFMHQIFYGGAQDGIKELTSIADGLSGPVEEGSITIPITKQYVDDIILVSEEEIKHSIAYAYHHYQEIIEGSAAAGIAAILSGNIKERPIVLIITGGNIDHDLHMTILREYNMS
jgi:threonine dehydratase